MKLNYKRTILIGFAFMAISSFWQVYDNIIPLILKYNFGIGDTLSGGIMALDNVFALFMLPIFGAWSDKVCTRRGKRTPFIFVGTIPGAAKCIGPCCHRLCLTRFCFKAGRHFAQHHAANIFF